MMKSLDPVARLREIAKTRPSLRPYAEDYFVPQLEILQAIFQDSGYTMVVRLTNDVEPTPAE